MGRPLPSHIALQRCSYIWVEHEQMWLSENTCRVLWFGTKSSFDNLASVIPHICHF